jgi:hypothetical protein
MTVKIIEVFPIGDKDNLWRDELFEFLNNRIDQILEQTHMEKIEGITGAIFRNKSEILGQFVLGFIRKKYYHLLDQEHCNCPQCNKQLKAMNKKAKRTAESLGGGLDLYRPYFCCKNCSHGFSPLDEALGLAPSPKQYDCQDLEAWLSSELPFQAASEAFKRCTGDS